MLRLFSQIKRAIEILSYSLRLYLIESNRQYHANNLMNEANQLLLLGFQWTGLFQGLSNSVQNPVSFYFFCLFLECWLHWLLM